MKESYKLDRTIVEKQSGILWYDRDDGYMLQAAAAGVPNINFRIKDMLRGHEGKRIRVTIEVLNEKGNQGSKG